MGKKITLNKAQKELYRQFDREARNVDLARKGVLGAGAVAVGAKKVVDNERKKNQTASAILGGENPLYES